MAAHKRKWYDNIYFQFYVRIPFFTAQTHLLTQAIERLTYDICRVRVELWKWKWEFDLYKKERY